MDAGTRVYQAQRIQSVHAPRITKDGKRNLADQDKEFGTHRKTSTSADQH